MYITAEYRIQQLSQNISRYKNDLERTIKNKETLDQLIKDLESSVNNRLGKSYQYLDRDKNIKYYFFDVSKMAASSVYAYGRGNIPALMLYATKVITITDKGIYKKTSKRGTIVMEPENLIEVDEEALNRIVSREIALYYTK